MSIVEIYYSAKCKDCKHCVEFHPLKKNGEESMVVFHKCELSGETIRLKNKACPKWKYSYEDDK